MKLILHPNLQGAVTLIIPNTEYATVEEIARKDVPEGRPFIIVERNQLPDSNEFFEAWEVDFSNPDGYGIGPHNWFIEKEQDRIIELTNDLIMEESLKRQEIQICQRKIENLLLEKSQMVEVH